jgi:hypothetical protein
LTIAISLKVLDGLVLASDSAATLMQTTNRGQVGVANVYNQANKIFNLRKGLPIGMVVWGQAAIGSSSIELLAKNLRTQLTGAEHAYPERRINKSSYSVADVAQHVFEFMVKENYEPTYEDWEKKPPIGFLVAGFSSSGTTAEEYKIIVRDGVCAGPERIREKSACGVSWEGEPEAISRLLLGYGTGLGEILLQNFSLPASQVDDALDLIGQRLNIPVLQPGMPFQDAIELARFLVDVSIQWSRFIPGAPSVGGPIEIAAITKHEGFKWVSRKHYFSAELNPASPAAG